MQFVSLFSGWAPANSSYQEKEQAGRASGGRAGECVPTLFAQHKAGPGTKWRLGKKERKKENTHSHSKCWTCLEPQWEHVYRSKIKKWWDYSARVWLIYSSFTAVCLQWTMRSVTHTLSRGWNVLSTHADILSSPLCQLVSCMLALLPLSLTH